MSKRLSVRLRALIAVSFLLLGLPESAHAQHHDHAGGHHHGHEEGVVHLSADAMKAGQVELRQAGPATLKMRLKVNGRIAPVSSGVAHITSRFPGIIREVRKELGDEVKAGETLALVESNQTLQPFEVRTLKSGLIVERHATLGEFAAEGAELFVVADLSEVWADFSVFLRDFSQVKPGQEIEITVAHDAPAVTSKIFFVSPVVDEATQSRIVRASLPNPGRALAPGAFVAGAIAVGKWDVPVAAAYDAIQLIEGKPAVFVQEGDSFEKREISAGRTDGVLTEVLSGLSPGETYVSKGSFLFKAELAKSEAGHDH
jgi:cobalt-zinc-cadmium efflux system membrane fusion protein